MMYILIAVFVALGIMVFPNIVIAPYEKYKLYKNKIGGLAQIASLNRRDVSFKSKMMVLYTCVMMIIHYMYLSIFQFLNKSIVKLNKNTYELTYMLNGNTYKILIRTNLGPQPKIIQALNELDEDITETISPYFGPIGNFHGLKYKPKDFNIKKLTLNMGDTRELVFDQTDEIILVRPIVEEEPNSFKTTVVEPID